MIVACAHCHQVVEDQDDVIVELEDVHTCDPPDDQLELAYSA